MQMYKTLIIDLDLPASKDSFRSADRDAAWILSTDYKSNIRDYLWPKFAHHGTEISRLHVFQSQAIGIRPLTKYMH